MPFVDEVDKCSVRSLELERFRVFCFHMYTLASKAESAYKTGREDVQMDLSDTSLLCMKARSPGVQSKSG
jgi:hypothetical protein